MSVPRHYDSTHKLADDIRDYVRKLVAERTIKKAASLLSTSAETLENLLDFGASRSARDRVERYARGMMRNDGLVPSERAEQERTRARKSAPKTEAPTVAAGWSRRRSPDSILEVNGVRVGQKWGVTEPSGREVIVTISYIVRSQQGYMRAYGKTPSGKLRALFVPQLVRREHARLLEDAAPAAKAAS
jgi:hypothetical protein